MAFKTISIPKLEDKRLIEAAQNISDLNYGETELWISCFGNISTTYSVPFDDDAQSEGLLETFLEGGTTFIDSAWIRVQKFRIDYHRGGRQDPKSPFVDSISIDDNQANSALDNHARLQIVGQIFKDLNSFDGDRALHSPITEEQHELASLHESKLDRLESISEALVQDTLEFRQKLDDQFEQKHAKLQMEFDDLKVKQEKIHQHSLEKLKNKEEELDRQRQELDDKNNTHARRQLRRDIIKEIKKRQESFSLTQGTQKLRAPIWWALIFLTVCFTILWGFNIAELYIKPTELKETLLLMGKQVLYTLGLVGTVLYLIRWQNRWFEQHSLAEFQLKQFELDIERASWIVETALEWKDAKGTTIPTELLKSISSNLFSVSNEKPDNLVHPADQLASALLGSASTISLNAGNSEIKIDPKKLTKVKLPNNV